MMTVEAELVGAVVSGAFDTPPWSDFLEQLRAATGAEFATLLFRPPGRPVKESLHVFAGPMRTEHLQGFDAIYENSLQFFSGLGMDEGRVYTFDDLYPSPNSIQDKFFEEVIVPSGIRNCLMVRVMEPSGVSAWLSVSRLEGVFDEAATGVMHAITPALRGALRFYVALEREKFAASVNSDAMRRLHFGWIALDADGKIIDHDEEAESAFKLSGILSKGPGGKLAISKPALRDSIFSAIAELLANPQGRARAFTLSQDPWLDMIILPAAPSGLTVNPRAELIAYIHGDSWQSTDRCDQLVQMFGLAPSEARLALALSRGMNFVEASASLGIKVDTARKYSKIIYSKTGAGNLADLVRIVMRSVLVLAPGIERAKRRGSEAQ